MIPAALAPLASHLWQSTLFAAVAALLTLALRRNHARVRYCVWLAASYKFLLPFSWLVSLGHQFAWRSVPASMPPVFSAMTEAVSTNIFLTSFPTGAPAPNHTSALLYVICGVWACGFMFVVAGWVREWWRIHTIARAASPLPIDLPICVLSTTAQIEPGVFGIFRPVLLLPHGIAGRLSEAQLQAILAHELCHVRRRDNLTAAIHMLVEALFWFYPLVWWLGMRMIDERERACDEEVLRAGSHAQVYAESILSVCKLYVESPLTCISGVTGSDLKERIRRIMAEHIALKLTFTRKLLLAATAFLAIAVPVTSGLLRATQNASDVSLPSFEVASIKRVKSAGFGAIFPAGSDRFTAPGITLNMLIHIAFGVSHDEHILGEPSWAKSDLYDIEAKVDSSVADELQKENKKPWPVQLEEQVQGRTLRERLLQSLLEDRFQFKYHHETKQLPVYWLVITKPGKLHEHEGDCGRTSDITLPEPKPGKALAGACGVIMVSNSRLSSHIHGQKVPLTQLAPLLTEDGDRPVLDKTGLTGRYDIDLEWVPEKSQLQVSAGGAQTDLPQPSPTDANGASLVIALREQLGLKLVPGKGPVEVIVIDHVERPSEN